jgi:hypothetical protein
MAEICFTAGSCAMGKVTSFVSCLSRIIHFLKSIALKFVI